MSALPPIADINGYGAGCPLLTHSGHRLSSDTAPLSSDTLSIAAGLSCRAGVGGGTTGRKMPTPPRRQAPRRRRHVALKRGCCGPEVQPPETAVGSALETVPNKLCKEFPISVRAPMAATETRAAIRPYSIAAAPLSSFTKRDMRMNITNSNFALRPRKTYAAPALRYCETQTVVCNKKVRKLK